MTHWAEHWPEVRRLLEDEGLTSAAVAERFGTTRQQISRLCSQNHFRLEPMRKWLTRKAEIAELIAGGASRSSLAARCGISENRMSAVLAYLGLSYWNYAHWTDEQRRYVVDARRRGLSSGQIAMRVPHSVAQVRSLLRRECRS